jgi:hypothetical protein
MELVRVAPAGKLTRPGDASGSVSSMPCEKGTSSPATLPRCRDGAPTACLGGLSAAVIHVVVEANSRKAVQMIEAGMLIMQVTIDSSGAL